MAFRLLAALTFYAALLSAQPARFVFAVIADPQIGMKSEKEDLEQFSRVVLAVNALKGNSRPDFVLLAGDLVNDASSAGQWAAMDAVRKQLAFPYHTVYGNHDPSPTTAESRFAFEHKGYLFLGMDSNLWSAKDQEPAKKQFAWLEEQLRGRERYRLVFILQHHPIYLHEPEEKDEYFNTPLAWRTRLLKLFEDARVTAVLAGHLHRNTTGLYRGISLLVTPSSLNNFDSIPPGFRLIEVHGEGFAETFVPVLAK